MTNLNNLSVSFRIITCGPNPTDNIKIVSKLSKNNKTVSQINNFDTMTIIDFSGYPRTKDMFSGAEKKICVLIEGHRYLLKFQRIEQFKPRYNHVSEHIGSSVFSIVGLNAQHTSLGTYNGENVVACRIFTDEETEFVPFSEVGESSLEYEMDYRGYSYGEIMALLRRNKKLTSVKSTIETFWDIYIIDGLLGNFDRHGRNWGFLKKNNEYTLAPVFDNGSCLFPKMTDENEMKEIMSSQEKTNERIYGFPTSQIKSKGTKSSYFEVISGLQFEECNKALCRMYPKIELGKINCIIDSIEQISQTHKEFYKHMIKERYEKIISYSYERLKENE